MTSRVNVKFVVILGAVLLALCAGVAVVGITMLRKSPEQLARLGDEKAAAGNWREAAEMYSRAVNKDPNDPRWLRLWIGAMERITPETTQEYQDLYFRHYMAARRTLVDAEKGDPKPAEDLLEEIYRRISRHTPTLRAWEDLQALTEELLRPYAGSDKGVGIARYRGLARVGIAGTGAELPRESLEQTIADLDAALARNPADSTAALALAELHRMESARRRQIRDYERADEAAERSRAVLMRLLEADPGNVRARLEVMRMAMAYTMLRASGRPMTFADLVAAHKDEVESVVSAARNAAPGTTAVPTLAAVAALMRSIPEYGPGAALSLIERELEHAPDSAPLMLLRADELQTAGRTDEALEQLQRIVNLPDRPLSLDGLVLLDLRNRAAALQVDFALSRWRQDMTASEKEAVMAEARRYRDALAARIGAERPELMFIDGKLRYAAGDLDGARTLLSRYNEVRGEADPAALRLLGEIMARQGNAGAAERYLKQALSLRAGDVRVLLTLASVQVTLRDYAGAAATLRQVLEIEPGNQTAAENLETVAQLEKGEQADDPVLRLLQDLERITSGVNPDYPAAIAALRAGIAEHGQDPRLTRPLVQLLMMTDQNEAARETLSQALAAHPNHPQLNRLKKMLEAGSAADYMIQEINESTATDFAKHMSRYEVYSRTGQAEKAAAELNAARALDPNSPRILDIDFVTALAAGNIDEAKRLADRAAASNADNVSGLTYRARVALVENRMADAASFLQQAAEADPLNPGIWRSLGDTRLAMQQFERASAAYDKALSIRPRDPGATKGLIRSLFGQGRTAEALAAARRAAVDASHDPEFVELWIALESSTAGGDRAKALDLRRQLVERNPQDRRGRVSLAQLLIASRQFDEARTIIDSLRAENDEVGLVELDASWHAARGDMAGATNVFGKYIESIPAEKRTETPYIMLSRILANAGFPEQATRVLEEGRKYQDPKVMNADRELADLANRWGRTEEAFEIVRRLLDAGVTDEGDRLRRGAIDCLIRLGRYDEAEAMIAAMGQKADTDAEVILLRAAAAAGRGDRTRARDLYDRAIQTDRENPRLYYARASFLASDPVLAADAEADLKQVIRLQPGSVDARQALAQLYNQLGRRDDALAALRDALTVRPDDDGLRRSVINALLSSGRTAEAIDLFNEAIARNPDSLTWLSASAEIYTLARTPDRALPHLEKAWSLAKRPDVAVPYITALCTARPPRTDAAFAVLAHPDLKTESNVDLLMTRALVRHVAGNQQRAMFADVEAAYRLLDHGDSVRVGNFLAALNSLAPSLPDRLRLLEGLRSVAPFTKWMAFNHALIVSQLPDPIPDAVLETVRSLADQNEDARLAMAAMQLTAQFERNAGRYEAAAAAFRRLLDINPEDPNSNNNYAYVVGCDLGRPAEALPYAEKAVRAAPGSAVALHTLGAIQLALDRLGDAATTLARAEGLAQLPSEKAPIYLSLAKLRLAQKDTNGCAEYLDKLERLLDAHPDQRRQHGEAARNLRMQMESR